MSVCLTSMTGLKSFNYYLLLKGRCEFMPFPMAMMQNKHKLSQQSSISISVNIMLSILAIMFFLNSISLEMQMVKYLYSCLFPIVLMKQWTTTTPPGHNWINGFISGPAIFWTLYRHSIPWAVNHNTIHTSNRKTIINQVPYQNEVSNTSMVSSLFFQWGYTHKYCENYMIAVKDQTLGKSRYLFFFK